VNGRTINESLSNWIQIEKPLDMYVLGFQELDLSAEAYVMIDNKREMEWCKAIEDTLSKTNLQYSKVITMIHKREIVLIEI
jgi:phosphatidylinositol-bisphosphatase